MGLFRRPRRWVELPIAPLSPAPGSDRWLSRLVTLSLALTVWACVFGSISLEASGHSSPELLTSLGTGALGALAGLLAPSPLAKP
jgi:hypothetical protein